jgi:hypothetical protein
MVTLSRAGRPPRAISGKLEHVSMTSAERNRLRSFPFLLRGLIPLTILTVLIVILVWPSNPGTAGVHPIDPGPVIAQARQLAPYPILAPAASGPTALPKGWRPTSAQIESPDAPDPASSGTSSSGFSLRVGYVTPSGEYAQFMESNDSVDAVVAIPGPSTPDGTVLIAAATWNRATLRNGEVLLSRTIDTATFTVTGSAKLAELKTLAASLS